MRERNVWLAIDGAAIALFSFALLNYARSAPQIASSSTIVAAVALRIVAFAIVVGMLNGGLLLAGRMAGSAPAGERLLSLLAGVVVLLCGCVGLWLVLMFSFQQY